jgi:hypothetical protein
LGVNKFLIQSNGRPGDNSGQWGELGLQIFNQTGNGGIVGNIPL